ncbi:hypothetical protein [Parvicella tangerina]|uniref:Uncharacterized protein n=1 Tax=Parvicella tangerina TaxID=2829795 RepID=A0A916NF21_9FLAO|nr:hypothetical protein [Parvicella tangerina]CAG5077488.1 hypothetical protein CRYO30217_00402 [Parvicella tangerina]
MKRKINIDRPSLSSQEIASRQDFTSLIKQLPKVTKPPFYKTGWFITTVASVTGILVITTNFIMNDNTSTPNQELATSAPTATPPSKNSTELIDQNAPSESDLSVTFVSEKETMIIDHSEKSEKSSDEYVDEQAKQQIEMYQAEMVAAQKAYEEASKTRIAFEENEPSKPIQKGNPDRQFVLDANPKDFPELASYKNLLFEVEANDPNFSPTVYEEEWEDIQLKTKEPGKTYYLTLYSGNISKTFSVFPVYQGNNYDVAIEKYNQNLDAYTTELQKKLDEEAHLKTLYEQSLYNLKEIENKEVNLSKTN